MITGKYPLRQIKFFWDDIKITQYIYNNNRIILKYFKT